MAFTTVHPPQDSMSPRSPKHDGSRSDASNSSPCSSPKRPAANQAVSVACMHKIVFFDTAWLKSSQAVTGLRHSQSGGSRLHFDSDQLWENLVEGCARFLQAEEYVLAFQPV